MFSSLDYQYNLVLFLAIFGMIFPIFGLIGLNIFVAKEKIRSKKIKKEIYEKHCKKSDL